MNQTAPRAASVDPIPSNIRVLRVDAAPASLLVEVDGQDRDGKPASVSAHFDAAGLGEAFFQGIFTSAIQDLIVRTADAATDLLNPKIIPVAKLDLVAAQGFCKENFDAVRRAAFFMNRAEAAGITSVLKLMLEEVQACSLDELLSRSLEADWDAPDAEEPREPPAPAPEKEERDVPPHADTSSREDGAASSSSASVGIGDTPPSPLPVGEDLRA